MVELNIPIFQRVKHWLIYGALCHIKLRTSQTYSLANFYYCLCSELCFNATSTFNLNLEFGTACWSFIFSRCNMTFDHYLCSKLPKRCPYLGTRAFFMVELKLEPNTKSVYLMNDSQNCYRSLFNVFMPRIRDLRLLVVVIHAQISKKTACYLLEATTMHRDVKIFQKMFLFKAFLLFSHRPNNLDYCFITI